MLRSVLIASVLLCVGFVVGAITHNMLPIAQAALQYEEQMVLANIIQSYEQRLSAVERTLERDMTQPKIVRGLVPLRQISTNLKSDQLRRFVNVSVVLAVNDSQTQIAGDAVAEVEPRIRDWLLGYLAGKDIDDVTGAENQQQLRQDIQAGINSLFQESDYPEFIKAVLLTEIAVK